MKSLNQRILLSASLVLFIFIVGTALTLDRAFYDSGQRALQDRMLGFSTDLTGLRGIRLDGI